MNFTTEEIAIITKVLIRQLMQDEGAIAELQKKLTELTNAADQKTKATAETEE